MSDAVITLKKGEGRALKAGGMWIYDNEIAQVQGIWCRWRISTDTGWEGDL